MVCPRFNDPRLQFGRRHNPASWSITSFTLLDPLKKVRSSWHRADPAKTGGERSKAFTFRYHAPPVMKKYIFYDFFTFLPQIMLSKPYKAQVPASGPSRPVSRDGSSVAAPTTASAIGR
jgi:hypothetical protein